MTEDQAQFVKKITTYLDAGTAQIKSGTAYRLQQARAAALARMGDTSPVRASRSRLAHALAGTSGTAGDANGL